MLLHEGLRECEPESRAAIPPRDQRVEDALADGLGHTRAVVLNMQVQCPAITLLSQRHLTSDARAQRDHRVAFPPALDEGLRRVVRDVEHGLDQLLAVATELG